MHNWETSKSRFIYIVVLGILMACHLGQQWMFSEWIVEPIFDFIYPIVLVWATYGAGMKAQRDGIFDIGE